MKKLSVALVALIVTAFVVHADVTSVNIVGVDGITLEPGKRIIMSAKLYEPAGDGTNTILGVFGTDQLVQAANPGNADRVIVFDSAASIYQAYAQYTDGHFYRCNNATEWEAGILGDDDVLETGGSFWLVHPPSADTNEISLLGEVLGGASHTQDVAIVIGYQLASYPYASEIPIQDVAKIADGATAAANSGNADRIVTWDSDAGAYQAYALYIDDVWYKCNDAAEWEAGYPATGNIPMSGGYWYISKTGFTLTDGCPYSAAY